MRLFQLLVLVISVATSYAAFTAHSYMGDSSQSPFSYYTPDFLHTKALEITLSESDDVVFFPTPNFLYVLNRTSKKLLIMDSESRFSDTFPIFDTLDCILTPTFDLICIVEGAGSDYEIRHLNEHGVFLPFSVHGIPVTASSLLKSFYCQKGIVFFFQDPSKKHFSWYIYNSVGDQIAVSSTTIPLEANRIAFSDDVAFLFYEHDPGNGIYVTVVTILEIDAMSVPESSIQLGAGYEIQKIIPLSHGQILVSRGVGLGSNLLDRTSIIPPPLPSFVSAISYVSTQWNGLVYISHAGGTADYQLCNWHYSWPSHTPSCTNIPVPDSPLFMDSTSKVLFVSSGRLWQYDIADYGFSAQYSFSEDSTAGAYTLLLWGPRVLVLHASGSYVVPMEPLTPTLYHDDRNGRFPTTVPGQHKLLTLLDPIAAISASYVFVDQEGNIWRQGNDAACEVFSINGETGRRGVCKPSVNPMLSRVQEYMLFKDTVDPYHFVYAPIAHGEVSPGIGAMTSLPTGYDYSHTILARGYDSLLVREEYNNLLCFKRPNTPDLIPLIMDVAQLFLFSGEESNHDTLFIVGSINLIIMEMQRCSVLAERYLPLSGLGSCQKLIHVHIRGIVCRIPDALIVIYSTGESIVHEDPVIVSEIVTYGSYMAYIRSLPGSQFELVAWNWLKNQEKVYDLGNILPNLLFFVGKAELAVVCEYTIEVYSLAGPQIVSNSALRLPYKLSGMNRPAFYVRSNGDVHLFLPYSSSLSGLDALMILRYGELPLSSMDMENFQPLTKKEWTYSTGGFAHVPITNNYVALSQPVVCKEKVVYSCNTGGTGPSRSICQQPLDPPGSEVSMSGSVADGEWYSMQGSQCFHLSTETDPSGVSVEVQLLRNDVLIDARAPITYSFFGSENLHDNRLIGLTLGGEAMFVITDLSSARLFLAPVWGAAAAPSEFTTFDGAPDKLIFMENNLLIVVDSAKFRLMETAGMQEQSISLSPSIGNCSVNEGNIEATFCTALTVPLSLLFQRQLSEICMCKVASVELVAFLKGDDSDRVLIAHWVNGAPQTAPQRRFSLIKSGVLYTQLSELHIRVQRLNKIAPEPLVLPQSIPLLDLPALAPPQTRSFLLVGEEILFFSRTAPVLAIDTHDWSVSQFAPNPFGGGCLADVYSILIHPVQTAERILVACQGMKPEWYRRHTMQPWLTEGRDAHRTGFVPVRRQPGTEMKAGVFLLDIHYTGRETMRPFPERLAPITPLSPLLWSATTYVVVPPDYANVVYMHMVDLDTGTRRRTWHTAHGGTMRIKEIMAAAEGETLVLAEEARSNAVRVHTVSGATFYSLSNTLFENTETANLAPLIPLSKLQPWVAVNANSLSDGLFQGYASGVKTLQQAFVGPLSNVAIYLYAGNFGVKRFSASSPSVSSCTGTSRRLGLSVAGTLFTLCADTVQRFRIGVGSIPSATISVVIPGMPNTLASAVNKASNMVSTLDEWMFIVIDGVLHKFHFWTTIAQVAGHSISCSGDIHLLATSHNLVVVSCTSSGQLRGYGTNLGLLWTVNPPSWLQQYAPFAPPVLTQDGVLLSVSSEGHVLSYGPACTRPLNRYRLHLGVHMAPHFATNMGVAATPSGVSEDFNTFSTVESRAITITETFVALFNTDNRLVIQSLGHSPVIEHRVTCSVHCDGAVQFLWLFVTSDESSVLVAFKCLANTGLNYVEIRSYNPTSASCAYIYYATNLADKVSSPFEYTRGAFATVELDAGVLRVWSFDRAFLQVRSHLFPFGGTACLDSIIDYSEDDDDKRLVIKCHNTVHVLSITNSPIGCEGSGLTIRSRSHGTFVTIGNDYRFRVHCTAYTSSGDVPLGTPMIIVEDPILYGVFYIITSTSEVYEIRAMPSGALGPETAEFSFVYSLTTISSATVQSMNVDGAGNHIFVVNGLGVLIYDTTVKTLAWVLPLDAKYSVQTISTRPYASSPALFLLMRWAATGREILYRTPFPPSPRHIRYYRPHYRSHYVFSTPPWMSLRPAVATLVRLDDVFFESATVWPIQGSKYIYNCQAPVIQVVPYDNLSDQLAEFPIASCNPKTTPIAVLSGIAFQTVLYEEEKTLFLRHVNGDFMQAASSHPLVVSPFEGLSFFCSEDYYLHLVASAIDFLHYETHVRCTQVVAYDDQQKLLYYTWSNGGTSYLYSIPTFVSNTKSIPTQLYQAPTSEFPSLFYFDRDTNTMYMVSVTGALSVLSRYSLTSGQVQEGVSFPSCISLGDAAVSFFVHWIDGIKNVNAHYAILRCVHNVIVYNNRPSSSNYQYHILLPLNDILHVYVDETGILVMHNADKIVAYAMGSGSMLWTVSAPHGRSFQRGSIHFDSLGHVVVYAFLGEVVYAYRLRLNDVPAGDWETPLGSARSQSSASEYPSVSSRFMLFATNLFTSITAPPVLQGELVVYPAGDFLILLDAKERTSVVHDSQTFPRKHPFLACRVSPHAGAMDAVECLNSAQDSLLEFSGALSSGIVSTQLEIEIGEIRSLPLVMQHSKHGPLRIYASDSGIVAMYFDRQILHPANFALQQPPLDEFVQAMDAIIPTFHLFHPIVAPLVVYGPIIAGLDDIYLECVAYVHSNANYDVLNLISLDDHETWQLRGSLPLDIRVTLPLLFIEPDLYIADTLFVCASDSTILIVKMSHLSIIQTMLPEHGITAPLSYHQGILYIPSESAVEMLSINGMEITRINLPDKILHSVLATSNNFLYITTIGKMLYIVRSNKIVNSLPLEDHLIATPIATAMGTLMLSMIHGTVWTLFGPLEEASPILPALTSPILRRNLLPAKIHGDSEEPSQLFFSDNRLYFLRNDQVYRLETDGTFSSGILPGEGCPHPLVRTRAALCCIMNGKLHRFRGSTYAIRLLGANSCDIVRHVKYSPTGYLIVMCENKNVYSLHPESAEMRLLTQVQSACAEFSVQTDTIILPEAPLGFALCQDDEGSFTLLNLADSSVNSGVVFSSAIGPYHGVYFVEGHLQGNGRLLLFGWEVMYIVKFTHTGVSSVIPTELPGSTSWDSRTPILLCGGKLLFGAGYKLYAYMNDLSAAEEGFDVVAPINAMRCLDEKHLLTTHVDGSVSVFDVVSDDEDIPLIGRFMDSDPVSISAFEVTPWNTLAYVRDNIIYDLVNNPLLAMSRYVSYNSPGILHTYIGLDMPTGFGSISIEHATISLDSGFTISNIILSGRSYAVAVVESSIYAIGNLLTSTIHDLTPLSVSIANPFVALVGPSKLLIQTSAIGYRIYDMDEGASIGETLVLEQAPTAITLTSSGLLLCLVSDELKAYDVRAGFQDVWFDSILPPSPTAKFLLAHSMRTSQDAPTTASFNYFGNVLYYDQILIVVTPISVDFYYAQTMTLFHSLANYRTLLFESICDSAILCSTEEQITVVNEFVSYIEQSTIFFLVTVDGHSSQILFSYNWRSEGIQWTELDININNYSITVTVHHEVIISSNLDPTKEYYRFYIHNLDVAMPSPSFRSILRDPNASLESLTVPDPMHFLADLSGHLIVAFAEGDTIHLGIANSSDLQFSITTRRPCIEGMNCVLGGISLASDSVVVVLELPNHIHSFQLNASKPTPSSTPSPSTAPTSSTHPTRTATKTPSSSVTASRTATPTKQPSQSGTPTPFPTPAPSSCLPATGAPNPTPLLNLRPPRLLPLWGLDLAAPGVESGSGTKPASAATRISHEIGMQSTVFSGLEFQPLRLVLADSLASAGFSIELNTLPAEGETVTVECEALLPAWMMENEASTVSPALHICPVSAAQLQRPYPKCLQPPGEAVAFPKEPQPLMHFGVAPNHAALRVALKEACMRHREYWSQGNTTDAHAARAACASTHPPLLDLTITCSLYSTCTPVSQSLTTAEYPYRMTLDPIPVTWVPSAVPFVSTVLVETSPGYLRSARAHERVDATSLFDELCVPRPDHEEDEETGVVYCPENTEQEVVNDTDTDGTNQGGHDGATPVGDNSGPLRITSFVHASVAQNATFLAALRSASVEEAQKNTFYLTLGGRTHLILAADPSMYDFAPAETPARRLSPHAASLLRKAATGTVNSTALLAALQPSLHSSLNRALIEYEALLDHAELEYRDIVHGSEPRPNRWSAFSNRTAVYLGGMPCRVNWVSSDGMFLSVTTPTIEQLCGNNAMDQCEDLALVVSNLGFPVERDARTAAGTTVYAHFEESLRLLASLPYLGPSFFQTTTLLLPSALHQLNSFPLPSSIRCPPACPRAWSNVFSAQLSSSQEYQLSLAPPSALISGLIVPVAPPEDSTQSKSAYLHDLLTLTNSLSPFSDGLVQVVTQCVGEYPSVSSGVCTDPQNPESYRCSWGAGDDCRVCPHGALCPGGYVLWPRAGYWVSAERSSSPDVLRCAAPNAEERCPAWPLACERGTADCETLHALATQYGTFPCGIGYKTGSPGCTACDTGYYPSLDGRCAVCPSGGTFLLLLVPMLSTLGGLAGLAVLLMVFLVLVTKRVGGTLKSNIGSTVQFLLWAWMALQVVAQATSTVQLGAPLWLSDFYSYLSIFLFQGVIAHPACQSNSIPFQSTWIRYIVVMSIAFLLFLVLSIRAIFKRLNRVRLNPRSKDASDVFGLAISRPSRRSDDQPRHLRIMATIAVLLFTLLVMLYASVTNEALNTVSCVHSELTVRGYLSLRQDGSTLRSTYAFSPETLRAIYDVAYGGVYGTYEVRRLLMLPLKVSTIKGDPYRVCYEAEHVAISIVSWLLLGLYTVGLPVATLFLVRRSILRHISHLVDVPSARFIRESHAWMWFLSPQEIRARWQNCRFRAPVEPGNKAVENLAEKHTDSDLARWEAKVSNASSASASSWSKPSASVTMLTMDNPLSRVSTRSTHKGTSDGTHDSFALENSSARNDGFSLRNPLRAQAAAGTGFGGAAVSIRASSTNASSATAQAPPATTRHYTRPNHPNSPRDEDPSELSPGELSPVDPTPPGSGSKRWLFGLFAGHGSSKPTAAPKPKEQEENTFTTFVDRQELVFSRSPTLKPFATGDYRSSAYFFKQIDMFSLVVLSVVNLHCTSSTRVEMQSVGFGVVLVLMLLQTITLAYVKPFPKVYRWKHFVKIYIAFLVSILFFFNFLIFLTYSGHGETPTIRLARHTEESLITALSILSFAFCIGLFVTLFLSFVISILCEAMVLRLISERMNSTASKFRSSLNSRLSSVPSSPSLSLGDLSSPFQRGSSRVSSRVSSRDSSRDTSLLLRLASIFFDSDAAKEQTVRDLAIRNGEGVNTLRPVSTAIQPLSTDAIQPTRKTFTSVSMSAFTTTVRDSEIERMHGPIHTRSQRRTLYNLNRSSRQSADKL